jgi:hypothetical protein
MKLSISGLRKIIREEYRRVLYENTGAKLVSIDSIEFGDENIEDLGVEEVPITVTYTYSSGGKNTQESGEYTITSISSDWDSCVRYVVAAMGDMFTEKDVERFLQVNPQGGDELDKLCNHLKSLEDSMGNDDNYY